MEKKVIFRDRQEFAPADATNLQDWASEAQAHLLTDAITSENQFVGLQVTAPSVTELTVAPGRLYHGSSGSVYALTQAHATSVFEIMPVTDNKWLAISVFGQEEEVDVQNRDFLINLQTLETQPQAVAMESRKVVSVHIAQGQESPTPEKPEPPTGYTLIAHVRLSPSGVQEIALATNRRLPNLQLVDGRLQTAEGWIKRAEPLIASLKSDIAGLGEAVSARATQSQLQSFIYDLVRLKELAHVPDDYADYGGDQFMSDDESDTAAVGYSARVEEGLRVPVTAQASATLALFNPIEPEAKVHADGFTLPVYTQTTRLQMTTQKGEIAINQYQYQTEIATQKTMSKERITYGAARDECTNSNFWQSGKYDGTNEIFAKDGQEYEVSNPRRTNSGHTHVRLTQMWRSTYQDVYWDVETVNHNVNGVILGQTILMSQTGWLTSVDIFMTHADPAGGLTLMLTEAPQGQPDLKSVIGKVDMAANALTTGWCRLPLPRPVFIEAGRRYAIVLSSGASHRVGYTQGTEYTQGVLMYAQDGSYFTEAADRDLMMRIQFAQFTTPRAVIQMQPLQLAGGITELDFLYEGAVPDGCELQWEYQVAGKWYPIISGTANQLDSAPALLPIRAVCLGTTDLMPGFRLTDSQVKISKTGTSFTHVSTLRTLATASNNITVKLLLEDFDDTPHNVACQLIVDGAPVNPTTTRDEVIGDGHQMWRIYNFALGSSETEYAIKIIGSTTDWRNQFHVVERFDLAL